ETKEYEYVAISASALKKAKKAAEGLIKKQEKQAKQDQDAAKKAAEASKKLSVLQLVEITENASLPAAEKIKLKSVGEFIGKRVAVRGWVHRLRMQKDVGFVTLRDGTGFLQSVLADDLAKSRIASEFTIESTILIKGVIEKLPEGKSAPGGVELKAAFFEIIGLAPSGDDSFTNKVQEKADPLSSRNFL
ncbi:nucleic acid-binding protein, partial [Metschnikowia bicuspidata]